MAHGPAVAAVFEPVQPPTTFQETVERLGTAIRLGILAPGTRLPSERELAEQLGISRSTLRQAITTLVQSGHLESVRGRGGGTFVVQEPPLAEGVPGALPADFRETLGLRCAIETGAAMLAAEHATATEVARLRESIAAMVEPPDFDAYRRSDVAFHVGIAEATHVPRVVALMTEVQGRLTELIAHIAHPPEVLGAANEEHSEITDAIEQRDGPMAAALLRRHLTGTEHILEGLRLR